MPSLVLSALSLLGALWESFEMIKDLKVIVQPREQAVHTRLPLDIRVAYFRAEPGLHSGSILRSNLNSILFTFLVF